MGKADGFGTGVPVTDPGVAVVTDPELAAALRMVERQGLSVEDRAVVLAALGLSETADTEGGVR